jgi:signal transduction histidine kinase
LIRITKIVLFQLCISFLVNANNTELQKIFKTNDTIYNHSDAVFFLQSNFKKIKTLSKTDSLDFEQRIAHRYIYLQQLDSALIYLNIGLNHAEELKKDSVLAYLLKLKGNTFYYLKDKKTALENFEKSYSIAEKNGLKAHMAAVLSNIGTINMENKDYATAEENFTKSINLLKELNLEESSNYLLVNRHLGTILYDKGDYNKSLIIFSELVDRSKKIKNIAVQSSAQTYKALTLFKLGKNEAAKREFEEVIELQKQVKNKDTEASVLLHYISFLKSTNNFKEALENFEMVWVLKKELFESELANAYSDAEIKYETQKKAAEIETQKRIIAQQTKEMYLYLTVSFLGIIILVVVIIVIRNKNKHKTELLLKEQNEIALNKVLEAEEKERSRIAKDLHDGIVQEITAIKFKLNAVEKNANREIADELTQAINQLDKTSKEVREISYQMMPLTLKELGLVKALEDLLNRTLTLREIEVEFENIGVEERLPEKIEVSIYRICQELLNNVLKHSNASKISLLLMKKENFLTITFEDNGKGFDTDNAKKGIGLNSLNSRVEMVKGTFEIDSSLNSGTTAYIRIPL